MCDGERRPVQVLTSQELSQAVKFWLQHHLTGVAPQVWLPWPVPDALVFAHGVAVLVPAQRQLSLGLRLMVPPAPLALQLVELEPRVSAQLGLTLQRFSVHQVASSTVACSSACVTRYNNTASVQWRQIWRLTDVSP